MTTEEDTISLVQAMVANAQRLGLIWEFKYATVTNGNDPAAIQIHFDNDSENSPVTAVSIIGNLGVGTRVAVITVPPSGQYIIADLMGGNTFRKKVLVTSTVASVQINVPEDICVLEIDYQVRGTIVATFSDMYFRINNDSNAQYIYRILFVQNASASAAVHSQQFAVTQGFAGEIIQSSAAAIRSGSGFIRFAGWNNPDNTSGLAWTVHSDAEVGSGSGLMAVGGGNYNVVGPYRSITIFPSSGNFLAGSQFYAKGWR